MPVPAALKLTVYYNTRCPVCDAGISRQKKRLLQEGVIAFHDINLEPDALARFGVEAEDVRRYLHAVDERGALLKGMDVCIAIWRLTPNDRWLAGFFSLPLILPLARAGYVAFAGRLYRWNKAKGHW